MSFYVLLGQKKKHFADNNVKNKSAPFIANDPVIGSMVNKKTILCFSIKCLSDKWFSTKCRTTFFIRQQLSNPIYKSQVTNIFTTLHFLCNLLMGPISQCDITLGWKGLLGTNTLAHWANSRVLTNCSNKLMCHITLGLKGLPMTNTLTQSNT